MGISDNGCHVAVDEAIEGLVTHAEQASSRSQPGKLECDPVDEAIEGLVTHAAQDSSRSQPGKLERDTVDETIEALVAHAEQDSSRSQPGKLERSRVPSEPPTAGKQAPKRTGYDRDVMAAAADKMFRCSKSSYFHPKDTPSAYINQILTDPYFKPVPKPALSSTDIACA